MHGFLPTTLRLPLEELLVRVKQRLRFDSRILQRFLADAQGLVTSREALQMFLEAVLTLRFREHVTRSV